ncbi:DUF359 domain-containing protein [Picrophilus oshimae]|uniref:GTP-dependent dephospho-CoA kinase n=1 Tax=Picrophilus torridus (strain ATCC 700027 / DSM 9790 / JCM 10055 / NBRC 100828 / KAW 2/3) TaxID=1122961 RepID=A0A8G2L6R0_PICTO|nr:DUF359 domain-containing protein [Picrophilus oshimae]SMD30238.1 hypothetical protein SAMN02745355_0105 [Picrophilus oshimae DSM 9789]
MQLKFDHDLVLNQESINKIKEFSHSICSIDDIKKHGGRIITVGDVTTENLERAGLDIFIEVVDLKTKRGEKTYNHRENSISIENRPGTISLSLIRAIESSIKSNKKTRIEINGEEDLAVIPIIFYGDINTLVVYGVPDTGMACIFINTEIKSMVTDILRDLNGKT